MKARDGEQLLPFMISRIDSYFQLVTLKASLIFPSNLILLALIVGGVPIGTPEGPGLPTTSVLFAVISASAVLLSMVFCARAAGAFLKGTQSGDEGSLIFFGTIAEGTSAQFLKKAKGKDLGDLDEDLAGQIHLLSGCLYRKFQDVNRSIFFLLLGAFSAMAFLISKLWLP